MWLMESFGRKVRNWRARIRKIHYDPSLSLQELINAKPKRVRDDQWKKLIKEWNKEEFKIISERNKVNRQNKKMVQRTGKKSYAIIREELKESLSGREPSRMEMFVACFSKDGITKNVEAADAIEEMKELNSQLPDGSFDEPGPNDIFAKVMGNEKDGYARMYGSGVRACDVWGVILSRSACYRQTMQWKSSHEQVSNQVAELKALIMEMRGSSGGASSSSGVPETSTCRLTITTESQPLRVGATVYVKSIINYTEIVAKGRVKSLDPNDMVGYEELGPNWCEINVQVAIKRKERLVRPYGLLITVEDAVGSTRG